MKFIKNSIIIILACIMISTCFSGCSAKGKSLMTLGDSELSVNTFQLFLSRQKGILCSTYGFGAQALNNSFWDTIMDASGTTYNDYYTDLVLENAKVYLAALECFNEKGLKLPDSYIETIDKDLKYVMDQDADGSKSAFNAILAQYGANYNILRDAYILEAKIAYLQEELFGADGSKIAPALIEDYFAQSYVRFKQVFIYTYNIVYETDENGDSIYYKTDGTVAYDTTKIVKKDENGNLVKDSKGNTIYVTEEGRIAYDKKKGARKVVVDASGNAVTEDFSAEKINQLKQDALMIKELATEGDYVNFDALVEEYNMDVGMSQYPNGYYITETTDYDSPEVVKALFQMEEGEVEMVQSQYGFHVIMKYELEEKPYEKEANADFFINSQTGEYLFMSDIINRLFTDYLKSYKEKVTVDESLLETVDIKSVGANFYY